MGKDQYTFGENSLFAKSLKIASCFNNDIAKSEVGYAFSNSNPDMNSLKFPKKGSDLIKMISDKKTSLQTQYDNMVLNQTGLKTKLTESGIVFSTRNGYDEATYDYNSTPSDVRDICYSFNDLRYTLKRQLDEIKTCQALIDNLEENKTYTLSTPQILSLQKAMKFDLMKGVEADIQKSEGSRGGKVIGHTKSGKPIYDSGNNEHMHTRHKDFSIKDHVEAADFHDQKSKKEGDGKKRMHHRTEEQFHIHAARDKGGKNKDLPEDWHSQDEKHKVGDHVIDSEGKKGKVTHADGKEVAVEHDNGDVSGYEHHQVKKYSDKKESSLEDELNASKPTGKEREVAAADDKKRADKAKAEKEAKKNLKKSSDDDISKAFESLGLTSSDDDEKKK